MTLIRSSGTMLSLSALLWLGTGSVSAFTQNTPRFDKGVVLQSSSEEGEITAVEETTATTPPDNNSAEEQDRVYYSILSQDYNSPTTAAATPLLTAGDVLLGTATPLNGWIPKPDYALWGLPGAIAPLGFFDPMGFARQGTKLNDAKRLRESEIQHGRVAMMATVGYFAGEAMGSTVAPFGISGPANDQLQQVPTPAFAVLTVAIAAAELYRATKGWVEPQFKIGSNTLWTLRENYYPGDLGFDPLGLKPTSNYDFQVMQTKELSHGRLAMIGWAGMCTQELLNHKTIFETLEFYQIVWSGGNPYGEGYYY